MREKFCDIVPNDAGWVYFIDGVESAVYPSYRLAVRAARLEAEQRGSGHRAVLRSQHLDGEMRHVGAEMMRLAAGRHMPPNPAP